MKGKSLQENPNIATNGSYTQDCKTSRVKTKQTDQNWELHRGDGWDLIVLKVFIGYFTVGERVRFLHNEWIQIVQAN